MKKFKSANIYNLTINKVSSEKSEYFVEKRDGSKGFSCSDMSPGGKIYMVIYPDALGSAVYVGQTKRSIVDRFYQGVERQGYSWAKSSNYFHLLIWDVDRFTKGISFELDAIESELTFACRLNQGAWPVMQTSIKFRWFRQSETARMAPYIVIKMIDDLYEYLNSKGNNTALIESQRERAKYLLKQVAI